MADIDNPETVHHALKAVSLVRSATLDTLKYLANTFQQSFDADQSSEPSKNPYLAELAGLSQVLETRVRELEAACTLLFPTTNSVANLENTQMVAQDPNYEKTSLYPDMVISYRWLDNVQEYSALALQAFQSKFTKRNSRYRQRSMASRAHLNNHNMNLNIDLFINQIVSQKTFETMPIEVTRGGPFGVFTVLKIVLDRTLRAVIVLRGLVIEWVSIKAYEENFDRYPVGSGLSKTDRRYHTGLDIGPMEDMDIWKPSRYKIFRTITDHANAAILHFYSPFQMDSAIRAYLFWLRSYVNLFSAKCRKCDQRLLNEMPPTWRDFRTNEPYHFECRP